MKTKMIVLTNSFHNTSVRVRATSAELLARYPSELSPSQKATARRIRAKLCGAKDCQCGVVR